MAFGLLLSACKYEDGVGISFRAKRDRFANEWLVKSIKVNDVDSTAMVYPETNVDGVITKDVFVYCLNITRQGFYSAEVLKRDSAGNLKTFVDPNGDSTTLVDKYRSGLPKILNYIGNHGVWTFNKKHDKVNMAPDLASKDGLTGITIFEIWELREKQIRVKGELPWDNNSPKMKFDITFERKNTKEPYWL